MIAGVVSGTALGAPDDPPQAVPTGAATPPAASQPVAAVLAPLVRDVFRLRAHGIRYSPNARNVAMRSDARGPLLLFLPATGAVPRDYRQFLNTAGDLGYHVLALDYWNRGPSVARTCERDANCYSDLQANRFDGSHPTRFSAIAPEDSILDRLRRALTTLGRHDPHGGWGRFAHGDHVRWNRIVVAGHSQGGGESAFIAHHHAAQGVLMFGSPVESVDGVTAAWMAHPGATPVTRYYAFDSRRDMYADRITGSWRALHLPGRPQLLGSTPPHRLAHQLVTDRRIGDRRQSHSLFITDRGPRGHRDNPVFQKVWAAMLRAVRQPSGIAS
jgi:hypothetical protein